MSGRSGRDPDDERRDRVKFPFGHSVDGPLDEVLRSDAGPIRFDSDEASLDALDSGELALDKTHPEQLDAFEELRQTDPSLAAQRPRDDVVYESGEGPVSWAPRFPGASLDEVEPEPLSPSEVGRLIDVESEKTPPKRLFDPIPLEPSRSGRLPASPPSGRAPKAPSGRAPQAPSGRAPASPFDPPPPRPDVVQRSEIPTQRIDPALVDDPPTFVTGGAPGPRPPGTPSGRHVTPLGPRPPATPSGRHAAAAPLAPDDPATLHTHVPSAPAPPSPGRKKSPFESDDLSVEDAPPIFIPLSASEQDGRQRAPATPGSQVDTVLDLERTHPHSEPELPPGSLDESLLPASSDDLDDLPRGLASGDELRWPDESGSGFGPLGAGSSAAATLTDSSIADSSIGGAPLLHGVVSDEASALAGSSMGGGPPLSTESDVSSFGSDSGSSFGSDTGADDDGSDMASFGRRTAEIDVPHVVSSRRSLFEESDVTAIPSLPELIGSSEGRVAGLLDSQELDPSAAGPPLPGAPTSPSLRVVQASVERVVGLWEGDLAWMLVSIGGAIIGPLLLVAGWEYYSLDLAQRPGHPLHHVLRPGGSMGLVFGLAGAALFLLNLTYVLRRRLGLFKQWISLRVWLNAHFICGLTGGSLILAHSALLANNDVARVSSLAIAVAIGSGVFGRYVLSHLPRRRDGEDADLSEREHVATRLVELRRQLRTRLGNQPELRDAALAALATDAVSQVSQVGDDDGPVEQARPRGVLYMGPLILSDLAAAARWVGLSMKVRRLLRRTDDPQVRKMLNETLALARVQRLEQRMAQFDAVQDLMDTWRGLHFIVALVVISTMALHVTIVLRYGRLDWLGR